jgi:hypothetical protein
VVSNCFFFLFQGELILVGKGENEALASQVADVFAVFGTIPKERRETSDFFIEFSLKQNQRIRDSITKFVEFSCRKIIL